MGLGGVSDELLESTVVVGLLDGRGCRVTGVVAWGMEKR